MKNAALGLALSLGMLSATVQPAHAAIHKRHYVSKRYIRHKRHMATLKRVGIGAAGGATVGAIAGGPVGALIGAGVGAGGGALYDRHQKQHGHY
jgi:outer membrane lipoprotein SlyB